MSSKQNPTGVETFPTAAQVVPAIATTMKPTYGRSLKCMIMQILIIKRMPKLRMSNKPLEEVH